MGAGSPLPGPAVAVVDYHKGNLQSMARGLARAGARVTVTDDPAAIRAADGVVLPGVGAFADAAAYMGASGQADAVLDAVRAGVPFLGVCLGMQLLFDRGTEGARGAGAADGAGQDGACSAPGAPAGGGWAKGLGVLRGGVTRLAEAPGAKVPHMGWNTVDLTQAGARCPLFSGVGDGEYFYFTHSFACRPDDGAVVAATTGHSERFASAVWDGAAVFGTQFHPEKSSEAGAVVLRNFVRVVAGRQEVPA